MRGELNLQGLSRPYMPAPETIFSELGVHVNQCRRTYNIGLWANLKLKITKRYCMVRTSTSVTHLSPFTGELQFSHLLSPLRCSLFSVALSVSTFSSAAVSLPTENPRRRSKDPECLKIHERDPRERERRCSKSRRVSGDKNESL